ncbi:MAG: hypothetical protein V2I33_19215 [Kangiellaceae bacterium]|nr:hypothetical protein [Kangiellaceae bacterium]
MTPPSPPPPPEESPVKPTAHDSFLTTPSPDANDTGEAIEQPSYYESIRSRMLEGPLNKLATSFETHDDERRAKPGTSVKRTRNRLGLGR